MGKQGAAYRSVDSGNVIEGHKVDAQSIWSPGTTPRPAARQYSHSPARRPAPLLTDVSRELGASRAVGSNVVVGVGADPVAEDSRQQRHKRKRTDQSVHAKEDAQCLVATEQSSGRNPHGTTAETCFNATAISRTQSNKAGSPVQGVCHRPDQGSTGLMRSSDYAARASLPHSALNSLQPVRKKKNKQKHHRPTASPRSASPGPQHPSGGKLPSTVGPAAPAAGELVNRALHSSGSGTKGSKKRTRDSTVKGILGGGLGGRQIPTPAEGGVGRGLPRNGKGAISGKGEGALGSSKAGRRVLGAAGGRPGEARCTSKAAEYDSATEGAEGGNTEADFVVEGVVHKGQMFLLDKACGVVYASYRDALGKPIPVGTWDPSRTVPLHITATVELEPQNSTHGPEAGSAPPRKKRKKAKKIMVERGVLKEEREGAAVVPVAYCFAAQDEDHCETSEQAYRHVAPILAKISELLQKAPADLAIYDPYFCQGAVKTRLRELGFPNVYNQNEDFYKMVESKTTPAFDVIVTNPPYSGDHVARILKFCRRSGKPWMLLLPNYVYLKDYYGPALTPKGGSQARPLFLVPPGRYSYYSPQGSRVQVKSSERKTSPFYSFWYIGVPADMVSPVAQAVAKAQANLPLEEKCVLARTTSQIPFKAMDSNDPQRKKQRDRLRSISRVKKHKGISLPK